MGFREYLTLQKFKTMNIAAFGTGGKLLIIGNGLYAIAGLRIETSGTATLGGIWFYDRQIVPHVNLADSTNPVKVSGTTVSTVSAFNTAIAALV